MTVSSQSGPRSPRPSEDLFTTATSALRRLHFKSGRSTTKNATKTQGPVPKVIVMGSSTTSETTLNTSTDSSNTIVTTMTVTDGDNTEDSLDITEPIDILNSENSTDSTKTCSQILQPTPVSPKTPSTAKQETKFTFDVDSPPKTAYLKTEQFVFDVPVQQTPASKAKNVDELMQQQVDALRQEARRRNSYRAAQHNYNSIDIAYHNVLVHRRHSEFDSQRSTPEHNAAAKERRSYRRKIDTHEDSPGADKSSKEAITKNGRTSPKHSKLDPTVDTSTESQDETLSTKPRQRHKRGSKRHSSPNKHKGDKFSYDEKHLAKYRSTPPDLRVDYFNEHPEKCPTGTLIPLPMEKRGSVCLNKCLREVGAQLDPTVTSPINVTTNPLDSSIRIGNRKVPQATIVVQQASLSSEQGNVSTVLLRNGSEFVSNVESAGNKLCLKKQREEHMKQLLDVGNHLTLEEMHDFEMRYGSPHHSRSQSVKTPGRASGRPNYLCLPQQRSRVASMPNTGVEEEYYRLRHFSITGKGVVNRGDSLKSRRSRSNNSVASSNSSITVSNSFDTLHKRILFKCVADIEAIENHPKIEVGVENGRFPNCVALDQGHCVIGVMTHAILITAIVPTLTTEALEIDSKPADNRGKLNDIKGRLGPNLNESECILVLNLINEFRNCFAGNTTELGKTTVTEMQILLNDDVPVTYRPYRLAYPERESVRGIVQDLIANGIVQESQSPYASPILLVKRENR
ncbi:uncharacterized protein LOC116162927 [Photinus pyralis]|nr:uncharacterized protein LOC116162927 [Photinus pyralis]